MKYLLCLLSVTLLLFSCSKNNINTKLQLYQIGIWEGITIDSSYLDGDLYSSFTYDIKVDLNENQEGKLLLDSIFDPSRSGYKITNWEIENFEMYDKITITYEKEVNEVLKEFNEILFISKNSYNYQEWTKQGQVVSGPLEGLITQTSWYLNRIE